MNVFSNINRIKNFDIHKASVDELEKYIKLIDKYEDFDKYNDWEKDTFDANKITLISNETFAKNKEPRILYAIEQLALKRESIMIQTPYAICNDKMYKVFNNQEIPKGYKIDHIDGDNKNNEISNLRYLCPNCHALTETYRGRNKALKNKCVESIHQPPKS